MRNTTTNQPEWGMAKEPRGKQATTEAKRWSSGVQVISKLLCLNDGCSKIQSTIVIIF
jgi:hypothetical protein